MRGIRVRMGALERGSIRVRSIRVRMGASEGGGIRRRRHQSEGHQSDGHRNGDDGSSMRVSAPE